MSQPLALGIREQARAIQNSPMAQRNPTVTAPTIHVVDTQQVEIAGRSLLVAHLVADGIEVAEPLRDRGVDLLAYLDLDGSDQFLAAPIQLKAFTKSGFGLDRKYERFPGLLLTYVWNVATPTEAVAYCLTYSEAFEIADELGWTQTKSWTGKGIYVTTRPSKRVRVLLEPHQVAPGSWITKLRAAPETRAD